MSEATGQPDDVKNIVEELRAFQAKTEERLGRLESLVNEAIKNKPPASPEKRPSLKGNDDVPPVTGGRKLSLGSRKNSLGEDEAPAGGRKDSLAGGEEEEEEVEGTVESRLAELQSAVQALQQQQGMHAPLFELLQRAEGGVDSLVTAARDMQYVRESMDVCSRRNDLAIEHAKSLMDTAVSVMDNKLQGKIDMDTYKEATAAVDERLDAMRAHVDDLAAQVADPVTPPEMQAFLDEVGGLGLGRRLEGIERKVHTLGVVIKEVKPGGSGMDGGEGGGGGGHSPAAKHSQHTDSDFDSFRNEMRKVILDTKLVAEGRPSRQEVGQLIDKRLANLTGKVKGFATDSTLFISRETFEATLADMKTQIANKVSQMEAASQHEAQRIFTLEETMHSMQDNLVDSMSRKANRVQVEQEVGQLQSSLDQASDAVERLAKHKADAKDVIRLQRSLHDLATLQKLASGPALMSKESCLSCDRSGGQKSPRGHDASQSSAFSPTHYSPDNTGRLTRTISPGPESPDGFYRVTHAKMNVLSPNEMLSVGNHLHQNPQDLMMHSNMFVPTSNKPPASFHTSKRNLAVEADLRTKGLLKELPPVQQPPGGNRR